MACRQGYFRCHRRLAPKSSIACANNLNGDLKVVAAGAPCPRGWSPLSWNVTRSNRASRSRGSARATGGSRAARSPGGAWAAGAPRPPRPVSRQFAGGRRGEDRWPVLSSCRQLPTGRHTTDTRNLDGATGSRPNNRLQLANLQNFEKFDIIGIMRMALASPNHNMLNRHQTAQSHDVIESMIFGLR